MGKIRKIEIGDIIKVYDNQHRRYNSPFVVTGRHRKHYLSYRRIGDPNAPEFLKLASYCKLMEDDDE